MKTLLIVVAALALAAVGSAVVWTLADGDGGGRRLAALGDDESLERGPSGALHWRGAFNPERGYRALDVVSHEGSSWIAAADMQKAEAPPKGSWDLLAQGSRQAGFNGTFQSPNGSYSLVVSDNGIVMQGPEGAVTLNSNGLTLKGEGPVTVVAAGNLQMTVGQNFATSVGGTGDLSIAKSFSWNVDQDFTLMAGRSVNVKADTTFAAEGAGQVNVKGSAVRLNCGGSSNAKPVARQSDQILVQSPSSSGQITQGSPTVLAC